MDRALVRVARKEADGACGRGLVSQHRMDSSHNLHLLEIAVGAGMKVGPVDLHGVGVVSFQWHARVQIFGVEQMSGPNTAQVAYRATQIHVVPGDQQPATGSTELSNGCALLRGE